MHVLALTNMYPTPQSPTSGTFVEQQIQGLRKIGVDVEVLFVDRAQRGMGVYFGLGRHIRAKVANFHPDVVHSMYGGVMADVMTRVVDDRPTVVSFCGSDLLGVPLSGPVTKLASGYGVLASHRAARRACAIVVKSTNLLDALPPEVDRSRVTIIPNGIDLKRFTVLDRETCCERLGWQADRFHVLFSTNTGNPCKRPDLALAAVQAFKRSGVQVEIHRLQGVSHQEVPAWLNASDVILLTSSQEGSPNIIKEALACNLPVVSVDVGDVRERIEGIEGCYLATPEPEDLAAKLYLVYSGLRRVSGRVRMRELSLERVAMRLEECYGRAERPVRRPQRLCF